MDLNAVDSGRMACKDGGTLALLLFLTSVFETEIKVEEIGQKANTSHKRGMGYADPLLQSPLTHTSGVPPYTASNSRRIVIRRRYFSFHVTGLLSPRQGGRRCGTQ